MNKVPTAATVMILSAICLGITFFMPLSELGLLNSPHNVPPESNTWLQFPGIPQLVGFGRSSLLDVAHGVQNDPNFQFYAYFFFLGMALIAASVALIIVGREEPQEKTVLPIKK